MIFLFTPTLGRELPTFWPRFVTRYICYTEDRHIDMIAEDCRTELLYDIRQTLMLIYAFIDIFSHLLLHFKAHVTGARLQDGKFRQCSMFDFSVMILMSFMPLACMKRPPLAGGFLLCYFLLFRSRDCCQESGLCRRRSLSRAIFRCALR